MEAENRVERHGERIWKVYRYPAHYHMLKAPNF